MSDQPTKDALLLVLAADRIAGMRYSQIAEKHGISVPLVRQRLRKAMMKGVVSAEQIRYKPIKKREAMPEGEYNAKWMRRVLANVDIDATGCWLWKGFRSEWGYAQTLYRNRTKHVHRQMYKVVNSVALTRWQFVMHKCDTPHCVNPPISSWERLTTMFRMRPTKGVTTTRGRPNVSEVTRTPMRLCTSLQAERAPARYARNGEKNRRGMPHERHTNIERASQELARLLRRPNVLLGADLPKGSRRDRALAA